MYGCQVPTNLFSGLELHKNTHAAISDVMGYQRMTKVQEQSIPVCLTGESHRGDMLPYRRRSLCLFINLFRDGLRLDSEDSP